MATQVVPPVASPYRFSVEDVLAMVHAGILDEHARVELIDGVLVEMSPIGPRHADAVEWLNAHLVPAAAGRFRVRVQDTLLTPGGSFFQPDVFVIEPGPRGRLPDVALLVVEVADTSLRHDHWKAATYATAGVPDYWIVDVNRDEVLVHRNPVDGTYASVERFAPGATITPLIDVPPVDVAELLAR
jgi:Uma2 family endonuclease